MQHRVRPPPPRGPDVRKMQSTHLAPPTTSCRQLMRKIETFGTQALPRDALRYGKTYLNYADELPRNGKSARAPAARERERELGDENIWATEEKETRWKVERTISCVRVSTGRGCAFFSAWSRPRGGYRVSRVKYREASRWSTSIGCRCNIKFEYDWSLRWLRYDVAVILGKFAPTLRGSARN